MKNEQQLNTSYDPLTVFVIGTTGSGKSTFINRVRKCLSDFKVGTVEVGKEMRRRYPPEHFKGRGAMASTEEEAWSIYKEEMAKCVSEQCGIVLVDGQPRMESQTVKAIDSCKRRAFLILHAPDHIVESRLRGRDSSDPQALELAIARMVNDKLQLYPVILELIHRGQSILVVDTSQPQEVGLAIETLARSC